MSAIPPRKNLPVPPEILLQILEYVPGESQRRAHQLAPFALVSRQFASCTTSLLYEDLSVAWIAGTARQLLRSLRANPALGQATRTFAAAAVTDRVWTRSWITRTERAVLHDGALAPWDRPDAFGLQPPHHEPEPIQETCEEDWYAHEEWEQEERRAYEDAWEAAAAQASLGAGHQRWSRASDRTADGGGDLELEEHMETISLFPRLRHLALVQFKPREVVPPAFESHHFAPARAVVGRLAGLALDRSHGAFSTWLGGLLGQPFHVSNIVALDSDGNGSGSSISPDRLSLNGAGSLRKSSWIKVDALTNLDFTLFATRDESRTHVTLGDWLELLEQAPLVEHLHVRLAPLTTANYYKWLVGIPRPRRHSPSLAHQVLFAELLAANTRLRTLAIEWWPVLPLLASLPTTLSTLALGLDHPFEESAVEDHTLAAEHFDRSALAVALQQLALPQLRTVALPIVPRILPAGEATPPTRYWRIPPDTAEFEVQRNELEAFGYLVRSTTFCRAVDW